MLLVYYIPSLLLLFHRSSSHRCVVDVVQPLMNLFDLNMRLIYLQVKEVVIICFVSFPLAHIFYLIVET